MTLSGLPKACASDERIYSGNVDFRLQTPFKNQKNSIRTQKQAVKSLLELLGNFQMPNQITAWKLNVDVERALTCFSLPSRR